MEDIIKQDWRNQIKLERRVYVCGHCGVRTGSITGYMTDHSQGAKIYICGGCNQPTYFAETYQVPNPIWGASVNLLPLEIEALYDEARKCTSLEAYTSCVLGCRKILMHIAVDKGADGNLSFLKYVEYLEKNHYIPPNGKSWVEHIRKKGNEANHEIAIMGKDDAEKLLIFVEMLLRFIYEFPELLNK